MKIVTINVNEQVYEAFKRAAARRNQSTSALIREAMEAYHHSEVGEVTSLADLTPVSLGKVKRPLSRNDDILGEMLDG